MAHSGTPNRYGDLQFSWNDSALRELLQSQHGDVARDLAHRAVAVETQAKINTSGDGIGPKVETGRLRASITWAMDNDSHGLYADVGTNVVYGRYLELGTVNMHPYPWLRRALDKAG